MKPVVELKQVNKIYKMDEVEVQALKNVNLKIEKNEFVSIMGASGSGKYYVYVCYGKNKTDWSFKSSRNYKI